MPQVFGHLKWEQLVAYGFIYSEALQLLMRVDEAEPVAIGKCSGTGHCQIVGMHLLDVSHELSHGLGSVG